MKKLTLIASTALLFSSTVNADAIGVYLGGQVWDNDVTGILGESGNQTNFNLSDEKQTSYFIAVEHPIPFIPNAKISSMTLDTSGVTKLTEEISFGGETFAVDSDVSANFDVSYLDYTVYYELFDNDLFSFDLGLSGRDFDGDVTVISRATAAPNATTTGKLDVDGIIPMVYASTKIGLPFTGLDLFAEGNFLSIDDHTLYDYQAGLSYELVDNLAVDFHITLGYRAVKLELEDLDDLYSDLEFKGVFAGAVLHF